MVEFKLESKYQPYGDQVPAIKDLTSNFKNGVKEQILLGATGTGKTFTMANIIAQLDKNVLLFAPNKTLAAQLYSEMREYFPNNRVEYFISNFDYYRPEAYQVASDNYIEKDSKTNLEIDQMRFSAINALTTNEKTIVVASVSCIYGIGDPDSYKEHVLAARVGDIIDRDELINKLISIQYQRNDMELLPGTFQVRGDVVSVVPVYMNSEAVSIEFFGDEIDRISIIDTVTKQELKRKQFIGIDPASLYVAGDEQMSEMVAKIAKELDERLKYFKKENKLVEYQRLEQRVTYDMEMLRELGSCSGVENYSAYFSKRAKGEAPYTLLDYFNKDFLMILDESHLSIPQLQAMYKGDRSRKENLVEFGFRLPSAYDNRPLIFDEFIDKVDQLLYVSATPGDYELDKNLYIARQIIRPTGLLDPTTQVKPIKGQIDDILFNIRERINANERTLITTLTKKMAEDLTTFLKEKNIKVAYLHSDVKTLERSHIINQLRAGKFDVLVGINLLREGLDLPEVSLICILDADKEGFLRNKRSFLQIFGRAARNAKGHVILYADKQTKSMKAAIEETAARRAIQEEHNRKHNIVPKTIIKKINADLVEFEQEYSEIRDKKAKLKLSKYEVNQKIKKLENKMKKAASAMDFETAIRLRDYMQELEKELKG